MPTNVDKALYPAGTSIYDEADAPIEIEIIDPEEVRIGIDGLEIEIEKAEPTAEDFNANLADFMEEDALVQLSGDLEGDIDNDKNGRKDWEKTYVDGLKLLGLKYEDRSEPWAGACGVFHPMITEAVVRFQSEVVTECFPAMGPCRTKIIGKETPEKQAAARRVEADMNYQLTERMVEFRPEFERLLWSLPATGSAFKKVYFDPSLERAVSVFVPAEDMLLPYGTSDLNSCYRITHVMRKTKNEIIKLQQAGFYRDVELGEPSETKDDVQKAKDDETGFSDINDDRFTLYECHVDLDLKGFEDKDDEGEETGIALPYVITLVRGANTVLSIRRNWREDDELRLTRQHFVHFQYIPGFGAYGFGLFHLIGGYATSATSLMRQLVDAGTLANLPGGLKSRGLRIKGDDTPIAPGEFRDVDVASGAIRDNILPLPYKEPSNTLFQLLGTIVEEGRRFAATADMKIADMSAQAPVGTTLALLERQLKVMTAVQARVHFAMKQELRLIADLIRDSGDDSYDYEPETGAAHARDADFKVVDIIPVSDPNAATMSQRVVQYQAVIQMAQMAPQIYDLPQLHRNMLEVLGIKNAEKLVPLPDDQKPKDPVTENMAALKGEPLKAFVYQSHEAHIQVHVAAMQDPVIAQLVGQNPMAPQIMAAMHAHIAEHTAFAYRQRIEQRLGMPLPPHEEKLPPEVEKTLSTMMAQAAQQVLQANQAQAAQQQAQQQAQDPVVQLQMREMAVKEQELTIKEKKLATEAAAKADDLGLREKKLAIDAATKADELELRRGELEGRLELEGAKLGHQIAYDKIRLDSDMEAEGTRIGVEIAKNRNQMQAQQRTNKQETKQK